MGVATIVLVAVYVLEARPPQLDKDSQGPKQYALVWSYYPGEKLSNIQIIRRGIMSHSV